MADDPFQPWLARWRLTPDGAAFIAPFGSRLMPVLSDGRPAMLKIAVSEEETRGAGLMSWYAGLGAARVFAHEGPALLLERLIGVRDLAQMARHGQDDEATVVLCAVVAELHRPRERPPPDSLVPLDVWFRQLWPAADRHGGTFAKAAGAARELLATAEGPVVLHGDLYHANVLDGGDRGFLAIDPKGLIGERGFDYANLFRNPDVEIALAPGQLRRRADIVAEHARLDLARLLRWVLAYAGLGAAWMEDSGGDPAAGLAIAEAAAAELVQIGEG